MYFGREGRGMLLSTEGAFRLSIGCYDATWAMHLELYVSVVRDYINAGESGLSEQCMVTTAEWDDVED